MNEVNFVEVVEESEVPLQCMKRIERRDELIQQLERKEISLAEFHRQMYLLQQNMRRQVKED